VKKTLSVLVVIFLLVSVLSACNQRPAVDRSVKPEEHFSNYKTLTDLYGTPWRDVLKKLDIDMQELDADGLNYVGIPLQETYADITFGTALRFRGDDNHLGGVEYTASYQYPEEEVKLLQDVVKLNRQLISDFGSASDTSYVFNWAEKQMGEKWNREISYWQDVQVLKRLLDADYSGNLLLWNLSSIAPKHIKDMEIVHALSISFYVNQDEGTALITISY